MSRVVARFFAIALAVSLVAAACGDDASEDTVATTESSQAPPTTEPPTTEPPVTEPPTADPPEAAGTIVEVAVESGAFPTLVAAVQAAGLVDNVRSEGRHAERRAGRDPAELPAEAEIDAIGNKLMIADALRTLPDRARRVVMLHYFEGFTHRQISERMSMPLGTVKSDLRRSLLQLRHQLESANE